MSAYLISPSRWRPRTSATGWTPALLIGLTLLTPAWSREQREPAAPASTSNRQVFQVQFLDDFRSPVSDIAPEEISVALGSRACSIVRLQSPEEPFRVGLLVDVSTSMQEDLGSLLLATRDFLKSLNPVDPRMIVTFDDDVYLNLDWTTAADEAEQAVKRAAFYDSKTSSLLYEAIMLALRDKFEADNPRQVLLLIADGIDSGSKEFGRDDVLAAAARKTAGIFAFQYDSREHYRRLHDPDHGIIWQPPVGATGRGLGGVFVGAPNPTNRDRGEYMVQSMYDSAFKFLHQLCTRSGGRHFPLIGTDSLEKALAQVEEELETTYTLTCECGEGSAPTGASGTPRIEVTRPGVTVKIR